MNAPQTKFEQFMVLVAAVGANRAKGDIRLYERLKNDLNRDCPDLAPGQYETAITAISRAAGV